MKTAMETHGYGFIQPGKIDWELWRFLPGVSQAILFDMGALQASYPHVYKKVAEVSETQGAHRNLVCWLAQVIEGNIKLTLKRMRGERAYTGTPEEYVLPCVWWWIAERLDLEFQREVLEQASYEMQPQYVLYSIVVW